jgi:hypothetical protein
MLSPTEAPISESGAISLLGEKPAPQRVDEEIQKVSQNALEEPREFSVPPSSSDHTWVIPTEDSKPQATSTLVKETLPDGFKKNISTHKEAPTEDQEIDGFAQEVEGLDPSQFLDESPDPDPAELPTTKEHAGDEEIGQPVREEIPVTGSTSTLIASYEEDTEENKKAEEEAKVAVEEVKVAVKEARKEGENKSIDNQEVANKNRDDSIFGDQTFITEANKRKFSVQEIETMKQAMMDLIKYFKESDNMEELENKLDEFKDKLSPEAYTFLRSAIETRFSINLASLDKKIEPKKPSREASSHHTVRENQGRSREVPKGKDVPDSQKRKIEPRKEERRADERMAKVEEEKIITKKILFRKKMLDKQRKQKEYATEIVGEEIKKEEQKREEQKGKL